MSQKKKKVSLLPLSSRLIWTYDFSEIQYTGGCQQISMIYDSNHFDLNRKRKKKAFYDRSHLERARWRRHTFQLAGNE